MAQEQVETRRSKLVGRAYSTMVSVAVQARRALVRVLLASAAAYGLVLSITGDVTDDAVFTAYQRAYAEPTLTREAPKKTLKSYTVLKKLGTVRRHHVDDVAKLTSLRVLTRWRRTVWNQWILSRCGRLVGFARESVCRWLDLAKQIHQNPTSPFRKFCPLEKKRMVSEGTSTSI